MSPPSQLLTHTKTKLSRLRSALGLLLLAVYALGNFALSQTALTTLGEMSGQHQVVLFGNSIVLHHPNGEQAPHRSFTKLLVALSNTNSRGDHMLRFTETLPGEEPRFCHFKDATMVIDFCHDSSSAFSHHCLYASGPEQNEYALASRCNFLAELLQEQWSTVKCMV